MKFFTRSQRIAGYLDRHERDLPGADHPRLSKLAGMIQRNGLLQTLVFLDGKARPAEGPEREAAEQDRRLLRHLRGGVYAALGIEDDRRLERGRLAECSPTEYLLLCEVALEVATWMARHADARQAAS